MTNTNPDTGVRYGVIALQSLDSDLAQDLMFAHGTDLSYAAAIEGLQMLVEADADCIVGEAHDSLGERLDSRHVSIGKGELAELRDDEARAAFEALGYADRDGYIQSRVERERDNIQIEEPVIEGECDGIKYRIDWLGGAPLLWVTDGPLGYADKLCNPCVPNAADLDSGFSTDVRSGGHECYVVPGDWLARP